MIKKDIIIFDFDNKFKDSTVPLNTIVLTNLYSGENVINVTQQSIFWDEILNNFNYSVLELIEELKNNDLDYINYEMYVFANFIIPLGNWFFTIDKLIKEKTISINTKVIFTSYSRNKKVFIFDAENEPTGQFLYQKSYFLSYYLLEYLKLNNFQNIVIERNTTLISQLSFYLRGIIMFNAKLLQVLLYKFITFNRSNILNINKKNFSILSSRGIVQTQLLHNVLKTYEDNFILLVNESSSKPFLNKSLTNKFKNTFYAEGFLTFREILSLAQNVINVYHTKRNISFNFKGLKINFFDVIPECEIKRFHVEAYATSVKNSINHLNKKYDMHEKNIISLDMLPPFAYTLKKSLSNNVIQLQGASIIQKEYPNYIYADKFYYTDDLTYKYFSSVYKNKVHKMNIIKGIKYIGTKAKEKIDNLSDVKTITFFTQPSDISEEQKYIKLLINLCDHLGIKLKIKPHPRTKLEYIKFDDVDILDKHLNSLDVVLSSDIVFTRFSTIGLDCWYLNVPVIFLLGNHSNIFSFIPSDYVGTVQNETNLEDLLKIMSKVITEFYIHPFKAECSIDEAHIIKMLLN